MARTGCHVHDPLGTIMGSHDGRVAVRHRVHRALRLPLCSSPRSSLRSPSEVATQAATPVRASLMITCLGDALFPRVGLAAVEVLGKLGWRSTSRTPSNVRSAGLQRRPSRGGARDGAGVPARLRRQPVTRCFGLGFARGDGPRRVPGAVRRASEEAAAAALAARTFEFSQFLVDVLGVEELPWPRDARRPPCTTPATRAGCWAWSSSRSACSAWSRASSTSRCRTRSCAAASAARSP